jgi:hypothetical protein
MDTPRPQVDVGLLNEIGNLMRNGRPEELVLRRYARRAEQLLGTEHPEVGWSAKAAVAALAWDSDGLINLAQRARQAIGADPTQIANLSVSFKHVNLMDHALECAREAAALAPGARFAAEQLIGSLLLTGHWSEALVTARELHRRLGDNAGRTPGEVEEIVPPRLEWLAQIGIDEEQVQRELREAWGVMREAEVRYADEEADLAEDYEGGSSTLCLRLKFNGDVDLEMKLGSMLAPRLARLPGWDPTRLSVDFAYLREDADATV